MVLLSIIIPVYNGEKYFPKLFSSLVRHNYEIFHEVEIIVVNDGSKDKSFQLLYEYKKKYQNVVIIEKPNGGIASARNAGLAIARGQYVTFCDQDDSLKKGYEEFLFKMDKLGCDMMITSYSTSDGMRYEFEYNELCGRNQVNTLARYMLAYGLVPYLEMPKNTLQDVSSVWNCIFKREFLLKYDIVFEAFVDYDDDWKFVTESLVHANTVCFEKDGFYCWTVNPSSESHTHKYISNYVTKRELLLQWIVKQLSFCDTTVSKVTRNK